MTEPAHLCVTLETCDLGDLRVVGGRDGREEVINTAGADSMTLPSYLSGKGRSLFWCTSTLAPAVGVVGS